MRRMIVIASAFAFVLGTIGRGQQSPWRDVEQTAPDPSGMQQVSVTDRTYGMVAYRLAIPSGWHFGGDIIREQGCHGGGMSLNYMMESADRQNALIQLAGVKWHWDDDHWKDDHNQRQCEAVPISSAADFLVNVLLPTVRAKAKIVSVVGPSAETRQQLANAEEKEMEMYRGWAQENGGPPPQHLYIDTANMRISYEIDGHPVEEMVTAVIDCYGGTGPSANPQRYPPVTNLFCSSRPERIVRAPQGKLDAFLASVELKRMMDSVQADQAWYEHDVRTVQAKIYRDRQLSQMMIAQSWATFNAQQQASQAFFNQLSENNRQFNENMIARGQQNMAEQQNLMAHKDAEAHRWINFAGDKADFTNSYTGQTVTLSNKYPRTFFSQDGTTAIQTNGWNPNSIPGGQVYTEAQPH